MTTLSQFVATIVTAGPRDGTVLRFGELFDRVREQFSTAEATEVDLAARPFERWQQDGYTYAAPRQLSLLPEGS